MKVICKKMYGNEVKLKNCFVFMYSKQKKLQFYKSFNDTKLKHCVSVIAF